MAATLSAVPKRFSGVSATKAFIVASRSAGVVPSIGSHIGVMIAAGWMELQRMASPCCAHHKATDLLWFLTAALELA